MYDRRGSPAFSMLALFRGPEVRLPETVFGCRGYLLCEEIARMQEGSRT